MFEWMNGKKTYLAAAGMILGIVGGWLASGDYNFAALIDVVKEAFPYLVAIFLRQGVEKAEKKANS